MKIKLHILILVGFIVISNLAVSQSAKQMLTSNWNVKSYGNPSVKVDLPVELSVFDLPVPENVKDLISSMQNFMYDKSNEVVIMVSTVNYIYKIKPDLNAAAGGFAEQLKSTQGISKFKSETSSIKTGNDEGIMLSGNYSQNGEKWLFTNSIYGHEGVLYQVLILYPYKNKEASTVADRISKSIQF